MNQGPADAGDELFFSADAGLSFARQQIIETLGSEGSSLYFSYLKDWLRGRRTQEEFDFFGLSIMPEDKKHLHTDFFMAVLNCCELSLEAGYSNPVLTSYIESSDESPTLASQLKNIRYVSAVDVMPAEEVGEAHVAQSEQAGTLNVLCDEAASRCGWLPDKSQVKGRMLLAAWEMGFEKVSEEAIGTVISGAKTLTMNVLEAALRLKRNHLVTESGTTHSYGVLKRASTRSKSRVVLPAAKPISARDILDSVEIDENLIKDPWLYSRLVTRLKAAEAETSGS